MTLKELREKRKNAETKRVAAKTAIDALLAESDRNEGVMSAEQSSQIETLEANYESATNTVAALDRQIAREQHPSTATPVVPGRRAGAEDGDIDPPAITDVKAAFTDDPKKGFKSHKEFFLAVMKPDARDERLRYLAAAGSDEQSTFSDSYGGFLLPEAFAPGGIMGTGSESDPLVGRTLSIPMQTPSIKMKYRTDKDHTDSVSGGLKFYRRAEAAAATSSRMQWGQFQFTAHDLTGLTYETEELIQDSPQSVIALIDAGFRTELGSTLLGEKLNGTGVGEYAGINNSPAKIDVAKETGQAAATIVYDNIKKMLSRIWGMGSAVWLANQTCLPQLMSLVQVVGVGGMPVWQPNAREGAPGLLMGLPLFFTEHCKAVGTVGDLLLVNASQYMEGTYQPLQSAESIHVRFLNNERTFKVWTRNAGSPWWNSVYTPKNGDTLSPFVRLATRA